MTSQVRKRRKEIFEMNHLLLIAIYSSLLSLAATSSATDTSVSAVLSQQIEMPCKAYAPAPGDIVLLILWYKDHNPKPIYSFDARSARGRHWIDEVALGDRANFIYDTPETPEPFLRLTAIQPQDEGVYICRVDYKKKPTLRTKIVLTVIIPPGVLNILNGDGVQVLPGKNIGPFDEGSTIEVACQVLGGKPAPQVNWWRREELLDGIVEYANASVFQNTLTFGPLTRDHLDAFLVCQASNTDQVLPVSKGVTVDINFKPLSVEIMGDREPLRAGIEQWVTCQSIGARPPANITWWLEDIDMTSQSAMDVEMKGNVSLSMLTIVPREEDAGKLLTCKAQSPVIKHDPLENPWKLEIYYTPKVNLQLDAEIDPTDIKEGDNVTFICDVTSNPKVETVDWYHKGIMIQHNASAGVKVRNHKLVLKLVERDQAGVYTCVASNGIGDGRSQPLFLNIKYVPVCSDPEEVILGAAKSDDVEMNCRVDASPGDVTFKWFFQTPEELLAIQQETYSVQDRTSQLNYNIRTVHDYGGFLCYASNELGEQSKPCTFTLVPAGKPEGLENCTLTNETTDTLYISCLPGFNGGLDQHFVVVVQAYDDEIRGDILRNATESEEPVFVIENLRPGASYLLAIYAENIRGRSEDRVLHGFTLPMAPGERITLPSTHIFPITPILGVLIGVVGALVLVAVVVVVVMKLRSDARSAKGSPKLRSEINLKGSHAPLHSAKDNDDGPDVILYPPYEDVDGIPPKLKHANIYETVQCDNKENSRNSENDDQDDVEYAELSFTNGKNKAKNNKKSAGVNGTIRSSEENTIYASIDHSRTAQQDEQKQKSQGKQAPQAKQDHQLFKGKQGIDHLDTAAQGETDDIPLMDTALESSV